MEGTVQQLTTKKPTALVQVLEVPCNADGSLEYGLQLCLRRTLMILKSFLLTVFHQAGFAQLHSLTTGFSGSKDQQLCLTNGVARTKTTNDDMG